MKNKILIGIISYLPNDIKLRQHRIDTLIRLINTCNYLFNLSIYIIIQNYSENEIDAFSQCKNVKLSQNYSQLGILGARRKLREYFINSSYSNLIMLDDDCIINGTYQDASKYLKQIEDNSDCFIEFNDTLLKLFCISKDIFKEVDYEDIHPELEEGFEDRVFVSKLRKLYEDKRRVFEKNGLEEYSISGKDVYSTWYSNQDIEKMLENTKVVLNSMN